MSCNSSTNLDLMSWSEDKDVWRMSISAQRQQSALHKCENGHAKAVKRKSGGMSWGPPNQIWQRHGSVGLRHVPGDIGHLVLACMKRNSPRIYHNGSIVQIKGMINVHFHNKVSSLFR